MESHYRDFGSDEQEEHRHSPFGHHRPPPPPPEDEDDVRRFNTRREDTQEGYPHGEWRRGEREEEHPHREHHRSEDDRRPPHLPHMDHGFHHHPEFPPHHEGPPDVFTQHDAPPHSSEHLQSHHARPSSDVHVHADAPPACDEPALGQVFGGLHADSSGFKLPQGRLVRIFCKGNSGFNLSVEHNSVSMKESKSEDEAQQWIKDVSHGMRVKDNYGFPAFSLVNKRTGKVLKHEKEQGQQVLLIDYEADLKDEGILWTESQDFGEGFKTVRSASDTLLNLTIFEGNKKIRNGSALVLDTWHKGDHQQWKLLPL